MSKNVAGPTAEEIYQLYPDSDLLGYGPPLPGESDADYISRAAVDGGDTLFLFLLRELTNREHEPVDYETAVARCERAIEDIDVLRCAFFEKMETQSDQQEGA